MTYEYTPGRQAARQRAAAANAAASEQRLRDRVEDVEFLLEAGESPDHIARRLGLTLESLERSMHRAGRRDLAHAVHVQTDVRRAYEEAKRRPCPTGCGNYLGRKNTSGLCTSCFNKSRAYKASDAQRAWAS
ncbi:hypothetical protein [Luteipulveratus mongoliensis]|uniref:Uncharacterized protein n=1 Tax=Luteipulveratus mongoliensis TaxID=571913 RepID=A0A0K1JGD0_9MICO|nr:hypothetical protein [Luteipulveratus mongoliensis]AKU15767.1 hypothetical protein VV02_07715 [Luteipulveratus mongoliensis]